MNGIPPAAYQIDAAHSGRAALSGSIQFPSAPAWSMDLGGAVSYPLIAGGRVFVVTAPGQGYGTQLSALDETSGATLWGPLPISGTYFSSGIAYDAGRVYDINFDGLLRTFDAASVTELWSVELPGQYAFSAAPTAANGIVYIGGAGDGGTLYAVDETTGHLLWTAGVANGDDCSPALSDDGVFGS
jgi:outer membrane protein assembly factor BamB